MIGTIDQGLLNDPDWVAHGSDALIEIFTDPAITVDVRSAIVAEEALVAITDMVANGPDFPHQEHGRLYEALITTWVLARGESTKDHDGQLLLGLVGAAIQCSVQAVSSCEVAIRDWWRKRKVARRIPWLLAALDTLLDVHSSPNRLHDLWIEGVDIVSRRGVALTSTERHLWRKLGRLVELDQEAIDSLLPALPAAGEAETKDPLAQCGLKKIAVVTLQERAGRQAAEELRARTGAEVVLVTSMAAGSLTRTAESADLILLVWAACKHAVFRAFDRVRDRLAYVQGTGPSSIILAAEAWAGKSLQTGPIKPEVG